MVNDSNMYPNTWSEPVLRTITAAARKVHHAHSAYLSTEDAQSEGYVWAGEHAADIENLLTQGKSGIHMMQSSLYKHMHKVAMKERYRKDGTTPGDYFLYSTNVVAELLPEVLDGADAVDASPSDLNNLIRSHRPVNERGDRAAMVADIQKVFKRLDEADRALLHSKYGDGGLTDEVVAIQFDRTQQVINYQLARALRRVSELLGGEPATGRQAISNARAQQTTRDQESQ